MEVLPTAAEPSAKANAAPRAIRIFMMFIPQCLSVRSDERLDQRTLASADRVVGELDQRTFASADRVVGELDQRALAGADRVVGKLDQRALAGADRVVDELASCSFPAADNDYRYQSRSQKTIDV